METKECEYCGKPTNNPRFCSRSCSAKLTNKEKPRRKLAKKCTNCDNTVRNYRSSLCESCYQVWKGRFVNDLTIGEYRNKESVKNKHRSWLHAQIRYFARSWNKDLVESSCAKCGYDLHVELAHIIPLADFEDSIKLSEVNSKQNLIQLCRNCHWEFDNGFFKEEFDELLKSLDKNLII